MKSFAKVNLTLEVLGKREDGYHNISSIFAITSLHDVIEVTKNNTNEIKIICSDKNIPTDEKNIINKVLKFLKTKHNINDGFEVAVEKNIPTEAGLGGGSSNAATVAKWFANEYNINLDMNELSKIGADIPFFLSGGFALVEGIGEKITPINTRFEFDAILVKPEYGSNTKLAFENLKHFSSDSKTKFCKNALEQNDEESVLNSLYNSFDLFEDEKTFLEKFGFKHVVLSGSGSTFVCFGNVDMHELKKVYKNIFQVRIG